MKTIFFTIREDVEVEQQEALLQRVRQWPKVMSATRLTPNRTQVAFRMCGVRLAPGTDEVAIQSKLLEQIEIEIPNQVSTTPLSAQPTNKPSGLPAKNGDGLVPTLNGFGFSFPALTLGRQDFVAHAAASKAWSLDIGCAFGLHTIEAIKRGARVVANDLDTRHLQVLRRQLSPDLALSLRTRTGSFTDISLPANSFGSVLASNVLMFLDGPAFDRAVSKLYKVMRSGGKAFVIVATPFSKKTEPFIAEFERRKAAGEKYPGFIAEHVDAGLPSRFHVFDIDTLSRSFKDQGFRVQSCGYFPTSRTELTFDGREALSMTVQKP